MLILTIAGIVVIFDVTMTLMLSPLGLISTCTKCNKKFDGTFLWVIIQQTVHRCDDNLI